MSKPAEKVIAEPVKTRTPLRLVPSRSVLLKTMEQVRLEMAKVYRSMKTGAIESQHGSRPVFVLAQIGRTIESSDMEKRLRQLGTSIAIADNRGPHQGPDRRWWIQSCGRYRKNCMRNMVGRARFELATNGLKVRCSTG